MDEEGNMHSEVIDVPLDPETMDEQGNFKLPAKLPVLPIRGVVMFPGTVMPLGIGRPKSRKMLEECLPKSKIIALVTQHEEEQEDPTSDDLYTIGTAAIVVKLMREPDDTISLLVHGLGRIKIKKYVQTDPYFVIRHEPIEELPGTGKKFFAGVEQLREQARQLIELAPNAPDQAVNVLLNIDQPSNLADFLGANLNLDVQQKQDLLEEHDIAKRIRIVHQYVSAQLEILKLQQKIQEDVHSSIGETQRKIFLREQLKAIQNELGEGGDMFGDSTLAELRTRIEEASPPEKAMADAVRELDRLESIPPASPEYSMILSYLELVADLPWNKSSKDNHDLDRAQKVLDRDHYGLDKVKRRLIEYLAVRKLNPTGRGPILCLVGPPGVGKTSLGHSIADALGREFVRMSFGGIRDEAEIRGHRRTYIGAMPGRIIQELKRAGTNNPVVMLDEIDKLGADFRGDPASALLEVLDPRQNNAFVDRYLDLPFDLSQVIFICTANYLENIPPALRDRMELIDIPGYTDNDKLQIAKRYLVPRQLEENGLKKAQCKWNVTALRKTIEDYTREAGVRDLERQIGSVCRSIAATVAKAKRRSSKVISVDDKAVREHLGPEKHFREMDDRTKVPGVVVGLAYTAVGGEILFIETTSYPGTGKITITGQLGDVMKESASAALSLLKSRTEELGIDIKKLDELDLHIHVPAGAVPKDGPSAGVSMFTSLVSLLLNLPVKPHIAMTGEITLRGLVLPIGGVKEKSLAASRVGVKTIIMPKHNERDLEEVDPQVQKKCKFVFVENVDELLKVAFGETALSRAIDAKKK
ncbi:MAG TPA: endopeptidase La [Phycisphaerales bacterium]|nr:endopeptidase La [Phycisphaerales bacterium]